MYCVYCTHGIYYIHLFQCIHFILPILDMSSTPATINAFRVFKPVDGTLQKVTPKHASYMILASAASFALDLLHSKRGYEILERLAKRTLQNMAAEPGARVVSRTQDYTQEFLQSIRANFPILIINDLGAMNARTQRLNWRTSEDTKFLSLHAGTIEVNELVSPLHTKVMVYLHRYLSFVVTSKSTRFKISLRQAGFAIPGQLPQSHLTNWHYTRARNLPPPNMLPALPCVSRNTGGCYLWRRLYQWRLR